MTSPSLPSPRGTASRPVRPGRVLFASLLAATLAAALALPAPAAPKLAAYAPAKTNFYIEVDDPKKLIERVGASPIMRLIELEEFKGVWEKLDFANPSFKEGIVEGIIVFDVPAWWKLVNGAVAVYNSDAGYKRDLEVAPGETADVGYHYDAVLVFEFPKDRAEDVRKLFREGIDRVDAGGERSRARVGRATVETYRVTYRGERTVREWNPAWQQGMPWDQAVIERRDAYSTPLIYEFAVLDGIALFGEGTNQPVTRALEASERTGQTLAKNPRFVAMMDLFAKEEGTTAGVLGYLDLEYLHAADEFLLDEAQRQQRTESGGRDGLDVAVQIDVTPARMIIQGAFGLVPERRGIARGYDHLRPVDLEAFAAVPSSVASASAIGLALGDWAREMIRDASARSPQAEAGIAFARTQGQMNLGIDPFDDILFRIGGTHLITAQPLDASAEPQTSPFALLAMRLGMDPGMLENVCIQLGLDDSSTVAERLATMTQKIVQLSGAEVIATERTRGVEIHTVLAGEDRSVPVLSYAAANGFLVIAPKASRLVQSLELAAGDARPLHRERTFRRLLRRPPADAVALSYFGEVKYSGAQASEMMSSLMEFLSDLMIYDGTRISEAYEEYSNAPTTEEAVDLGWQGRAVVRRTDDRLFLRAEYFPAGD